MRTVVQRVNRGELRIVEGGEPRTHAQIGPGLVALVGIEATDTPDDLAWTARKLTGLRVFEDDSGKMNRSLTEACATLPTWDTAAPPGILLVPNFTVAGRAHKGRRPDFTAAMPPDRARPMFDDLTRLVSEQAERYAVVTGVFGANMHVEMSNDGPITIWLDSRA